MRLGHETTSPHDVDKKFRARQQTSEIASVKKLGGISGAQAKFRGDEAGLFFAHDCRFFRTIVTAATPAETAPPE